MRAGLVMNSESLEYGDHLKKVAIHAALIRHDLVSEVVQVNHSRKFNPLAFFTGQWRIVAGKNRLRKLKRFSELYIKNADNDDVDVTLSVAHDELGAGIKALFGMSEVEWERYFELHSKRKNTVFPILSMENLTRFENLLIELQR